MISSHELRQKWLDFYKSKGHVIIPSAGVLPDNDPTALFHNSGMHPLVPYLMGEKHPAGIRLANAQKCIRTIDIDEVGDATHLTFFEMLGNWSLGDYFKKEQIAWSFEFLTQELKLPLEKLAFSVFEGDDNAPRDNEAAELWEKAGVSKERIAFLPASENWWAKGDTGPCGPDSEMFYWTGDVAAPANFQDTHDDPRWVEIWNDVFMTFNKDETGKLIPLAKQNIDTGMGLERTVAVLNGKKSVYETDAFVEILEKIAEMSDKPEVSKNPMADTPTARSARIIADHIRTATIILADKVAPSNVDQGYILRRIIRRAIRHGRLLGIHENICVPIAETVIKKLGNHYPELMTNKAFIWEEFSIEENQFRKTLEQGEKEFEKVAGKIIEHSPKKELSGKMAFNLYETYGFPLEMTIELAEEKGLFVDTEGFKNAEEKHKEASRAGAEKKFQGGLSRENIEEEQKLHTATHLLHAALKQVLGDHVEQRGSNITAERLRFDFSHPDKMTPEQVAEVEKLVNEAIQAKASVTCGEMSVEEAKAQGAIGLFEHKYGDKVKVYSMGNFSKEICGGPHVDNTGTLECFKIQKEEASSRGVRRIKGVIGQANCGLV
jgi:alanyl-tRNA synthetase